jgi:hypothetical protein
MGHKMIIPSTCPITRCVPKSLFLFIVLICVPRQLLGVSHKATLVEIKSAYRRLAIKVTLSSFSFLNSFSKQPFSVPSVTLTRIQMIRKPVSWDIFTLGMFLNPYRSRFSSEDKFKQIAVAYSTLSDPEQRFARLT